MSKKPKFNIGDKVVYGGLILTITAWFESYGQIYYAFDHDKLSGIVVNEHELIPLDVFHGSQNIDLINDMLFPHLYPGDIIRLKDHEGNWKDCEVINVDEDKVYYKSKNTGYRGSCSLAGLIKGYNQGEIQIVKGNESKRVEKEMNDFLKKVWINYLLDKYNETRDKGCIDELKKYIARKREEGN